MAMTEQNTKTPVPRKPPVKLLPRNDGNQGFTIKPTLRGS